MAEQSGDQAGNQRESSRFRRAISSGLNIIQHNPRQGQGTYMRRRFERQFKFFWFQSPCCLYGIFSLEKASASFCVGDKASSSALEWCHLLSLLPLSHGTTANMSHSEVALTQFSGATSGGGRSDSESARAAHARRREQVRRAQRFDIFRDDKTLLTPPGITGSEKSSTSSR